MANIGLRKRGWRALVLMNLCWVMPALLLWLGRDESGLQHFLRDWGAWSKFLIAPVLLTLAEKPIGFALDECISLIFRIPVVATQSMQDARKALANARSQTSAVLPELACLLLALMATGINAANFTYGSAPAWAINNGTFTRAGLWSLVLGNTIYWFLLTRLVWKHVIWLRFLSNAGRWHLRLAVTHPDGHAGLGFLGFYPAGYSLFVLAASAVVASGAGHVMQREAVTPLLFTAVCVAWLSVVLVYFAIPLVPFGTQVARLKRKAILMSLRRAMAFERFKEREALETNLFEDEAEDRGIVMKDVKPVYLAARNVSALLVNRRNAPAVFIPALAPFVVVGGSYLPFSELGPIIKRLLLL
ncbi:hypothetical protein GAO09_09025 [Rhizobiales bacterium RZME27]|uniref:Uncharacterized protein n=2 Tax=Endobacterium cereale TaxID=2663029 RepID=A0A6A8ABL4_9HYPH|nr:hypothetical protein [Endobacterium cereale]